MVVLPYVLTTLAMVWNVGIKSELITADPGAKAVTPVSVSSRSLSAISLISIGDRPTKIRKDFGAE